MKAPKLPYEELTSADNKHILGSLTSRSWHLMNVVAVRAVVLPEILATRHLTDEALRAKLEGFTHPLQYLVDEAVKSSGSIGGEHRRDLKESLQGQKPAPMSLVMGQPVNGQGEAQEGRRGL